MPDGSLGLPTAEGVADGWNEGEGGGGLGNSVNVMSRSGSIRGLPRMIKRNTTAWSVALNNLDFDSGFFKPDLDKRRLGKKREEVRVCMRKKSSRGFLSGLIPVEASNKVENQSNSCAFPSSSASSLPGVCERARNR